MRERQASEGQEPDEAARQSASNHDRRLSQGLRSAAARRVAQRLDAQGWWPPENPVTRHHVAWSEVASVVVDAVWDELARAFGRPERLPLSVTSGVAPRQESMGVAREEVRKEPPQQPWLDADEVAPLLNVTPHTLRRLARENRCPITVRRIGGRWWFARVDLERFLPGEAWP